MSKVNENIRFKLFFANSSAIVDLPTRLAPFIKSAYLSLLFSFHSYISSYIFLLNIMALPFADKYSTSHTNLKMFFAKFCTNLIFSYFPQIRQKLR